MVETGVGEGIGCTDDDYHAAGAEIVGAAADVFAKAEMVVKVKEPQPAEVARLREGQILFTYLHLAADLAPTQGLAKSGPIDITYETVTPARRGLPLLAPLSAAAVCLPVRVAAPCLEKNQGGSVTSSG